ncbi:MAG: T9SS type A sorting domain-containing protein, partial [Bacteroidota bacterium]
VEVFNGISWVQLTAQNMMPAQPDSANFDEQQNNFSEAIYSTWLPGQSVSPDSSWWKTEAFNISTIIANIPNAKIRWKLSDQNLAGGDGRAGWFIDDISVLAAPCELFPPSLTQLAPIIQNSVLSLGPYTLNINLTDASGIDTPSVALIYTVNSSLPDTVSMTNTTGNIFSGVLPAVADSDTVCYYFYARDNSPCHNPVQYPASGCISFVARSGLIISFCDDFDLNNFWTTTTVAGSSWQYGTPTGSPPAPHSPPNSWEVALGTQYLDNTICYLTSPDISFINVVNAKADLWFYSDCENTYDGTRLEYSTNLGVTWNVLGNVGTGVNWYNNSSIFSSSLPGWCGIFGWTNATHTLTTLNNEPTVRFRFVFTSDASVVYNGFAVDDFCLMSTTAVAENNLSQENLFLDTNTPNPYNNKTTISYSIPKTGLVEIIISDLTGKQVLIPVNDIQKNGIHQIEIEASQLSPGIYFYSMKFRDKILTRKMAVVE